MGDDQLFGAGGEDVIEGDCGDDTLAGGAGSDTFIFDIRASNDTITDFTAGNQGGDIIAFAEGIFADFSELTAASEQVGDDIVISFDDNSVVLEDVALSDLDAGNLLFA
jgi:Ca2+-binding RTX toxin-like protein